MSKTYDYIISNGHHLIKIEGHTFVVDTGSPISFPLISNLHKINLNGQAVVLHDNLRHLRKETLDRFIGESVDGFLGMDLLMKFGGITFNKDAKNITIQPEENIPVAKTISFYVKDLMGMASMYMPVNINGHSIYAIFDTGACIGYAAKCVLQGTPEIGNVRDYSPELGGEISTTKHKTDMLLGEERIPAELGRMTFSIEFALRNLGCDAVIGINDIPCNALKIDFTKGQIQFA